MYAIRSYYAFHLQIATQEVIDQGPLAMAIEDRRHGDRAGTCSAGQGFSGPPLPGTLPKLGSGNDLHKLHIGAVGEKGMFFQHRSVLAHT